MVTGLVRTKSGILLTKFINHIDNTLDYKSQVELSIQMSYSNRILYQNAAATRKCDAATTTLLPLQPLLLLKQDVLCHRIVMYENLLFLLYFISNILIFKPYFKIAHLQVLLVLLCK